MYLRLIRHDYQKGFCVKDIVDVAKTNDKKRIFHCEKNFNMVG